MSNQSYEKRREERTKIREAIEFLNSVVLGDRDELFVCDDCRKLSLGSPVYLDTSRRGHERTFCPGCVFYCDPETCTADKDYSPYYCNEMAYCHDDCPNESDKTSGGEKSTDGDDDDNSSSCVYVSEDELKKKIMNRDPESGKKKKSERIGRSRPSEEGMELVVFLGLVIVAGISVWALVESKSNQKDFCSSKCCKDTRTFDLFDFSNSRTVDEFCIQRSTSDEDDSESGAACPFKYFSIIPGILDGADGSWDADEDDGELTIDSRPFTFTFPQEGSGPVPFGGLDHVKFLTYVSDQEGNFKAYPTHAHGDCADATELVYEGYVSCQVDLARENIPYGVDDWDVLYPEDDYRLAACGFNTIAFQEFNNGVGKGAWNVADFFLTNRSIFILAERLPFGKPAFGGSLNDYAAFTEVIRVARRNPEDFHKLAIAYNAAKGIIRYLIDDEEVHRNIRPGYRPDRCNTAILHGGEDENSFPEYISVGFGTFTILDAYHWDAGICEGSGSDILARLDNNPVAYYDPHSVGFDAPWTVDDSDFVNFWPTVEQRIWGQGAAMTIDYVRVYNRKCGCSQ